MKRLKELRKSKNISQKDFAEYMNVAQNTVSRWENGDRLMDTDTLLRAARYFGVSTDYLLGVEKRRQILIEIDDPIQEELLDGFVKLSDIGKKEAVKRISELTQIQNYRRAMPIAAHNDAEIDEKEMALMQEDIDEL